MKKKVITAFDVDTARKAGLARIAVPDGALVTPQAADDARDYGITLTRGVQSPMPDELPPPVASPERDIAEAVRRRVLARLGNSSPHGLDAAISSVIAEIFGFSVNGTTVETAFVHKAGGVRLVASSALPVRDSVGTGPAAASMVEAVPPEGTLPGIAYMSWENSSFAWTFPHAEVLVVLEGEIALTAEDTTVTGKPGDSFLIPPGSAVTLAAKGVARCVHSSWPNLATAKG